MRVVTWLPLALVLGCGADAAAPGLDPLVGRWQSRPIALSPRGTMDRLFVVRSDGTTENHTTSRGLYPDQTADQISARVVLFGRISVRGDRVVVQPDSEVTQDLFYGPNHRAVRRDFSGWRVDTVRYAVRGDELHLRFSSYPADAPEPAEQVLYRVP